MTAKKSQPKSGSAKSAPAKPRCAATPAAPAKARAAKQVAPAKVPPVKTATPRQPSASLRKPKTVKPAPPRKATAKPAPASQARQATTAIKPSRAPATRLKPKQGSKTPSHVTTPSRPNAKAKAPPAKKPTAKKPAPRPANKPAPKPAPKPAHAASAKGGAHARAPFTPAELETFYQAMQEMRKRLLVQVSELRQQSLLRHDEVNQDEDGTDAFERVTSLDRASVEQAEIVQIDNALMAIREGTYGLCDVCSCKIERTRLRALPFAKTCIHCQSEMENQNSRRKSTHDLWD